MLIRTARTSFETISPTLARRIVERDERPGDAWHHEYPFADEIGPLRNVAASTTLDPVFAMYLVRDQNGLAVGGFGFFGPPDERGAVQFGYGLVPAVRGAGLATEVVRAALDLAAENGAKLAAADTDVTNGPSQRVLVKAGLTEVRRSSTHVFFERDLHA